MDDPVNHPSHYTQYEHEVIELTEQLDFCVGNACKYILRAPYKGNEIQDLRKALWYIDRSVKAQSLVPHQAREVSMSFNDPIVFKLVCAYPCDRLATWTPTRDRLDLVKQMIEKRILELEIEALRKQKAALENG